MSEILNTGMRRVRTVRNSHKVLEKQSLAIKDLLREALGKELPGEKAHRLMLPQGRELFPDAGKTNMIQSSVLMHIFPHQGEIHTCLIRRPETMRNHGGQLAFPGGRYEVQDQELIRTAIRESAEEIGTEEEHIEIIGALTPIYVQVSNFTINPFIGWSETYPVFKIDTREVAELFVVPLEKFIHPETRQLRKVETPRGTLKAPGFFLDPLFVWGATAMIISEFSELYRSVIKSPR